MGYLGAALVVVIVLELVLTGSWAAVYFQVGIPIFRKRFSYTGEPVEELQADELSAEYERTFAPSVLFRRLGPGEIAFREKILQLRLLSYTPVMHGIIRDDRFERTVSVTGYANWFPLSFVVFWYAALFDFGLEPSMLIFVIAPFLVLGLIYGIQYRLFRKIFQSAKSRYSVRPVEETAPQIGPQF